MLLYNLRFMLTVCNSIYICYLRRMIVLEEDLVVICIVLKCYAEDSLMFYRNNNMSLRIDKRGIVNFIHLLNVVLQREILFRSTSNVYFEMK